MCFFEKYNKDLHSCTKPYRYVGGEYLSYKKDFNSAKVRFAVAFPDKYEIGISNLGVRILYDVINKHPDYMCDRVYAIESDFAVDSLYALESKRPIKEFDAIGFSLQYEMSYPTVLKMLEMAQIPYLNSQRDDNDPIIIAGGPCTFNPLPMSDFIDVFMIGDGEDAIIEICNSLEKTKGLPRKDRIAELCKIEGCWSAAVNNKVNKRVSQLKYETAPKSYPIPYSSSVQDRAVVEIRRGCGRMCRFCQPGHVTLPVRERSADDIIKITKELVKNTGYDEYSLLSLSSNDYTNINEVIKSLAADFNDKKISVSLPSQRIDGFNLELANLVQSVRKSTMTLAPEAGSQRLRDVIKKNITEDQILNAILTLYENGWSRVKLYFICGLPTETLSDMDEMIELFKKIRYRSKELKSEKGLKHSLDLTCTLSIFVPKPFTPFQWCAQMNLDKVTEHIKYLTENVKFIKGVKINYHEKYVSMLEAVLTRGDSSLCKYIEALYKKGCYLDAWGEYFNKNVWLETADELKIDLYGLAQKQYDTSSPLPWNFVNIGIDKDWFISEYNKAFDINENSAHIVPTCQQQCVGCGVCQNLAVNKNIAKKYDSGVNIKTIIPDEPFDPSVCPRDIKQTYRYRIKITKMGILKYFSHLDWQNTFFKAISRSDLEVAFSHGFNPTMKISMGIALPLFCESLTELVDVEFLKNYESETVAQLLGSVLPEGARIINVCAISKDELAIDRKVSWAEYKISVSKSEKLYDFKTLMYNTEKILASDEILVERKNKKGITEITNIRQSIGTYRFEDDSLFIVLKTGQGSEIPSLRADVLMNAIAEGVQFDIVRIKFLTGSLHEL